MTEFDRRRTATLPVEFWIASLCSPGLGVAGAVLVGDGHGWLRWLGLLLFVVAVVIGGYLAVLRRKLNRAADDGR